MVLEKLSNQSIKERMKEEINEQIQLIALNVIDLTSTWMNISNILTNTMRTILGYQKKEQKKSNG